MKKLSRKETKLGSIIPSCELASVKLTEEYILSMEAFLKIYPLKAFEAQIILEVSKYPDHHVDINTLTKKIPKEFFKNSNNDVEASVKSLINTGYLQTYKSKKEVLCVLCTPWGRDVARQITSSCFSESLKFFDAEIQKIDVRRRKLCYDPLGLRVGEKRFARGPKGKIEITILGLLCSDNIYAVTEGRVEYEIRVVAEARCPQCKSIIPVEYCLNPATAWQKYLDIECEECGYLFSLSYSLINYYEIPII